MTFSDDRMTSDNVMSSIHERFFFNYIKGLYSVVGIFIFNYNWKKSFCRND